MSLLQPGLPEVGLLAHTIEGHVFGLTGLKFNACHRGVELHIPEHSPAALWEPALARVKCCHAQLLWTAIATATR